MPKTCECRECGEAFQTQRPRALFCSTACRQEFNRRRRDRGAELYDFVMAGDKDTVKRLVDAYKACDMVKRGGRPSWQDAQTARFALPSVYGRNGDKR